jgi:putative oxidoreductase
MFQRLIQTKSDGAALVLRVLLGVVMFPHGAQKTLGWFGGYGFSGTMGFFKNMGIPAVFGFLAIMAESLGSLGLISGLLTRVAAFGIFCEMLVAVLMIHIHVGFFMNWYGAQKGEGVEYHLLAMAISIALMIKGGGSFSADGAISKACQC